MPESAQIATSRSAVEANAASSGRLRGGSRGRRRGAGRSATTRVELAARARAERAAEPLLELLRGEPALARGLAQALGGRVALGVGGEQAEVAHRRYWPWKPNGMWCGASARASSPKRAGVEHEQERAPGAGVEHDREDDAAVLGLVARGADEDRLARDSSRPRSRRPPRRWPTSTFTSRSSHVAAGAAAREVRVAVVARVAAPRSRSAAARRCRRSAARAATVPESSPIV